MKKINGIVSLLIATFSISATAQFSNCVYLASDVYPGSYGSLPTNMTLFNGVVYFGCTGSMAGNELWKYENGVASIVSDLNPGFAGSQPNNLTVMGSYLYFTASNGTSGNELFRFDGTTISLAADINPGANSSFPTTLTVIGSEIFFFADNGSTGMEPFKYNGTAASLVLDINPGSSSSVPYEICGFNGDAFFIATSAATGQEVWHYDGSTTTVFDIYPGTTGSNAGELTNIGTHLCFRANDGTHGYEVLAYDGTTLTNLDGNPGIADLTPWELTAVGNELLFRGFNTTNGYELWKFDGTTIGMVMNINPGSANSHPNNLTASGSDMYFAANNGTTGNELWHYSGGTATLISDIKVGSTGSMPAPSSEPMVIANGYVFVVADNGFTGNEVFVYDGSTTYVGKNIAFGGTSSTPTMLRYIDGKLFFQADNLSTGGELWIWDPEADLTSDLIVQTCSDYTSPAGNYYNAMGTYNFIDTIPSVTCPGCDSIITIELTITDQPGDSVTIVTCDTYTSPLGNFYMAEGNYVFTEIIPSIACPGLDSIINIDLTIIDNVNISTVVFDGVILSLQSGATYQWLDCDNGMAPIPGATDQDFIPTVDGNYACEVSAGSCVDTTVCKFVDSNFGVGISTVDFADLISIYPNPATEILNVKHPSGMAVNIEIYDGIGNLISSQVSSSGLASLNIDTLANGIYFLKVSSESGMTLQKFIRQ